MDTQKIFEAEIDSKGNFNQQKPQFTKAFGFGKDEMKPEPDRYHLVWMPACPHSHKLVIVNKLLGLDRYISVSATGPYRSEFGWTFSDYPDQKDPITKASNLLELYLNSDPNYTGRPTVPAVIDKKENKVVNNDHLTLSLQFETVWKDFHQENAPDLYPESLRSDIDSMNKYIYEKINVGVYKVGFSQSQEAYEKAFDELFEAMDNLEDHLRGRRFLIADQLTDADIRIYPTLVRFDSVYNILFKANHKRLVEYPNLSAYTKHLYQMEAFRTTTDFEFIKKSYYLSPHMKEMFGNKAGILPLGPDLEIWE